MNDRFLPKDSLVKVVGNRAGHDFTVGNIVKIIQVDEADTYLTYYGILDGYYSWLSPEDVIAIAETPGEDCIF